MDDCVDAIVEELLAQAIDIADQHDLPLDRDQTTDLQRLLYSFFDRIAED